MVMLGGERNYARNYTYRLSGPSKTVQYIRGRKYYSRKLSREDEREAG
jgi:hypothetical protein